MSRITASVGSMARALWLATRARVPSYALSTFTPASNTGTADGTTPNVLTLTLRDTNNALMPNTGVTFVIGDGVVSASQSTLTISPATIAVTTESATLTFTARNAAGVVLPNIQSARIVYGSTGSNNTFGTPTVTDKNGASTCTFSSTTAQAKTISVTVDGTLITQTAAVTVASAVFERGPNAPAWGSTTAYATEYFDPVLPLIYTAANASNFRGLSGFDGSYDGALDIVPLRVTYPSTSTPLGTKPVIRFTFPGSTNTIDADEEVTVSWPTNQAWGVYVTGTWVGTLEFEYAADAVNFVPFTMQGRSVSTGTSTTVNGLWASDTPDNDSTGLYGGLFRVRASAWTSGTATIALGMQGGESWCTMDAGAFPIGTKKVYTRVLAYIDSAWTNSGNVGTKFFFFAQLQGNNNYVGLIGGTGGGSSENNAGPFVGIQGGTGNRNIAGTPPDGPANGAWIDVEYLFIANTAGTDNGTAQVWIDGVQYINQTNVGYFGTGDTTDFRTFFFDPTYGGGERPPNSNVFFELAAWYTEVAP